MSLEPAIGASLVGSIKGSLLGLYAGEEPTFSPEDISGLQLWFDASDTATITESSGLVSQWDDKSTNAFHVREATNKPTYGSTSLNGVGVISFDGSNDKLLRSGVPMSSFFSGTGTTVFIIKKFNSGVVEFAIGNTAGSTTNRLSFEGGNRADLPNDTTSKLISTSTTGAWKIFTVNRSTSDVVLYYDGVEKVRASNSNTLSSETVQISMGVGTNGFNFGNVDIAEIIIYNKTLSSLEMNMIGDYLASKWSLTWTDI